MPFCSLTSFLAKFLKLKKLANNKGCLKISDKVGWGLQKGMHPTLGSLVVVRFKGAQVQGGTYVCYG